MSDTQAPAPNLHPTLCIGFGSYGQKVLRQLLLDSEAHGLLRWRDLSHPVNPAVRSLKDLVLVHVRERAERVDVDSQIARDLFRQIRTVSADEREIRTSLLQSKQELLDESLRNTSPGQLRLGLDVFVVAQPRSLDTLGTVERSLLPAMDKMASDVGLRQQAQGAARINFILFLDFDNYWENSAAAANFRQDVRKAIQRWEDRMQKNTPSFGRIYVLDGHTAGGNREEAKRIEELVLFLQCALFAGMRDNPALRDLFQRETDLTPPLGTFGIRVIERSQGLTEHLVAAYFAVRWLAQMRGSEASVDGYMGFKTALNEFRPENLDLIEPRRELQKRLQDGLLGVENELAQLDPNQQTWPELLETRLAALLISLKADLSAWAGSRTQQIVDTQLRTVAGRLQQAVTGALHSDNHPAPLGTVIQQLQELRQQLVPPLPPARQPATEKEDLDAIRSLHQRYRKFKLSQVNTAQMGTWWLLLAGIATAAWTPVAIEAVQELPAPASTTPVWMSSAFDLLSAIAKPIILAPVLVLATWALGRYVFQRAMQARVERGLLVFMHPERGWIIGQVRAILQSSGIRVSLETYAREVFETMARRLRSVIVKQIDIVLQRLQERRKELEWLRIELRNFLISYGVDPEKPMSAAQSQGGIRSGYRYSLQKMDDFDHLLRMNPPTQERFESTQSRLKPFAGWADQYSDCFLYPVTFLERLSQEYKMDNIRTPLSAQELTSFLKLADKFTTAFEWNAGVGAGRDVISSYCILPDEWKELGAESRLLNQGFSKQHIIPAEDSSRAYLLRLQLRVSSERLEA
jgi:hypothetical protein